MEANERWEKAIQHELEKIKNDDTIIDANKKTIQKFKSWLEGQGAAPATVWRHIYCFSKLCMAFDKDVNIVEANKDQVEVALGRIQKMKQLLWTTKDGRKHGGGFMDSSTREKTKSTLKFLKKHFKGQDQFYPPEVWSVKIKVIKESKLTPSDLVLDSEFAELHRVAKTARTHAILEILNASLYVLKKLSH